MGFGVLVIKGRLTPRAQTSGLRALYIDIRSSGEVGLLHLCDKGLRREVTGRDHGQKGQRKTQYYLESEENDECSSAGCDFGDM